MGAGGGAVWHSVKGFRNSPRGARISGMATAVKARAPVLGGNFAIWGGLFSCFDCSIAALRKKEDPWNAILSGALTGAVLSARGGRKSMVRNFVVGGAILAVIEGLNIFLMNYVFSATVPGQQDSGMNAFPPPVTLQLGGHGGMGHQQMDVNSQALDVSKVSAEAYQEEKKYF
jgi:import inner membrane translocase subunit TIM17